MRPLVLQYGRARVWAGLIIGGIALILLSCAGLMLLVRDEPPLPADPASVLARGGHTIRVSAVCQGPDGQQWPLARGSFEVLTHSGQQPEPHQGPLVGNVAQVVVEAKWIGQIRITDANLDSRWGGEFEEFSEWIGEPYGWHDRVVVGPCSPP